MHTPFLRGTSHSTSSCTGTGDKDDIDLMQEFCSSRPVASLSNGKSGLSMAGTSVVLEVVEGDEIRLYNSGGEIEGDGVTPDFHFHFIGVLLSSNDRH